MGKHVSRSTVHLLVRKDKYCVYWAYRPTHSCPGHFTSTWHYLGTHRHSTPTNRGPLVLGSQTRICSEAAGSPHSWLLSCIFALLEKQSLTFRVCPATWPIIRSHSLLSFMDISPHSAGLASSCLAPRSHPASICFSECLPISVLLLPFMPSTSQFPAFHALPVPHPPTHTHTTTDCLVYPSG